MSNGSLLTAPDMRGRLRGIRERGGKVVVVDPRRTRTAEEADEHHFIRPGTDALLLAAMACTLVEEELADPGPLAEHLNGLDEVLELAARLPARAGGAARAGSPPSEIRRMARELAAAPRAAVYGRIGTCTQEFGTLASLAGGRAQRPHRQPRPRGRRDVHARRGRPEELAPASRGSGKGVRLGRWHSRVRGLAGDRSASCRWRCLAEEIDTPGEGQVRALITVAGNPLVSTPNAGPARARRSTGSTSCSRSTST